MSTLFRLILISILSTGVVYFLYSASFFRTLDVRLTDALYETQERHTDDVVVVAIDEKSLQDIDRGGLGRWQDWQRSYYAQVVNNLQASGAAVIGLDIFFSESRSQSIEALLQSFIEDASLVIDEGSVEQFAQSDDTFLKSTLASASGVVLAAKTEGDRLPIYPTRAIYDPAQTPVASVSLSEDFDNIVRSLPLIVGEDELPYSFAFEITKQFLRIKAKDIEITDEAIVLLKETYKDLQTGKNYGPIHIPIDTSGEMLVNYRGQPYSIPQLSFVDVFNNNFNSDAVRDKIVLIGEMDAGLHDEVYTPVSSVAMPGVEVHANAIETILTNTPLTPLAPLVQWSIVFILVVATSILTYFCRSKIALPSIALLAIGYIALAYLLLHIYGSISSMWYPLLSLIVAHAGTLIWRYLTVEKEKHKVVDAFSHYISNELVDQIVKDPSMLQLGGVREELSISFTDIAGFTSLSEILSPEELTSFLHDYLDTMTKITLEQKGTLDKYIGDAIMAFWGAPLPMYDHAERSIIAALEMHKALGDIRTRWKDTPELAGLSIRTGIATGEVTVGNFGSQTRFDYTVIGDVVNLASRLEGINKVYGTAICVDEETYLQTKAKVLYRQIDRVRVQGKSHAVYIYQALGYREEASVTDHELVHRFEEALGAYHERNFEEAISLFTRIHNDTGDSVAKLYTERSNTLLKNPPHEGWNGIFTMKTK